MGVRGSIGRLLVDSAPPHTHHSSPRASLSPPPIPCRRPPLCFMPRLSPPPRPPLPFPQAALPPNPTSLLHTEASSVGRSNPVLFDAGADNLLPGARTAKGPLLKGAPASGRDAPPQRGAHAPVPAPRASGGSSDEGKVDRVEEEPDWPVPSGGLRKRETFGPGVSPGSSPWLGPTRTAAAHAKRAQSPSLFYGLR